MVSRFPHTFGNIAIAFVFPINDHALKSTLVLEQEAGQALNVARDTVCVAKTPPVPPVNPHTAYCAPRVVARFIATEPVTPPVFHVSRPPPQGVYTMETPIGVVIDAEERTVPGSVPRVETGPPIKLATE